MALIKTEKEIAILREGGKIHARIMDAAVQSVRPGMEIKEIDDLIFTLIKEAGGTPSLLNFQPEFADRPFPASSCISVNEEVVHGIPNENNRTLKEGDIVGIDFGLEYKGMYTDMAITVPVGKISPITKKLLSVTKEALQAGIDAIRAGKHVGDIGYAIEKVITRAKFGLVEDLCGHGVGNSAHEDPYIPNYGIKGDGEPLLAGMVLAVEPMVNEGTGKVVLMPDGYTYRTLDKKKSAHFEHTILVTENGAEILTTM